MSKKLLFIVIGGSGSGKDELVKALNLMSPKKIKSIQKFTDRKTYNDDVDDILKTEYNVKKNQDLIIYNHFNYNYGIQLSKIWEGWNEADIQVLILSNFEVITKLIKIFGPLIKCIYIHTNIKKQQLIREFKDKHLSQSEIQLRLEHNKYLHEMYSENIHLFSHVLLNTGYAEDMFDQVYRLVRYYSSNLL